MHILQVISHYLPAYRFGGPLRVAHGLGCALVRAGHEVTVCTTNLQDEAHDLDVPLDQPVDVDGVRVYYEQVRFLRYWGFSPALYNRIQKEMCKADVVFVHAHYQFANWAGAYLARKNNKLYAIFAHSSLHREAIAHRNQWLKRLYLSLWENQNLRQVKFIAFNAEEEKQQSLFAERGVVIPSGVDTDEFVRLPEPGLFRSQYPELREKTLFLFLGRLDIQQKGLDLLIPAFAQVAAVKHDVHLVLAGPDEDDASTTLRKMVDDNGISQNVTFTGLVSGDLKKAVLQDADVFVLPSRFEGLSIALLEALYMGLPVLVTDRVGLCRTIQKFQAGVVAQPDVQSVAQALSILSAPQVRVSMRGRAIPLVREKYTWDAIANKLLEIVRAPGVV